MPSPQEADGNLAYAEASATLAGVVNQFPNSALDYPSGAGAADAFDIPTITTDTELQTLVHVRELFKLHYAMSKLSRESSPLANLYLRNRVDYHAVRLETALWMDWEYDRKNATSGMVFKKKLLKDGMISSFVATETNTTTIIGALFSMLDVTGSPLKGWNAAGAGIKEIKEFFKLLRDKLTIFFADTERIESEYDRVNRYVTAYIDTQMDRADAEVSAGAGFLTANVAVSGTVGGVAATGFSPITLAGGANAIPTGNVTTYGF